MAGRFEVSATFKGVDKMTRPVNRMTRAVNRGARVMGKAVKSLTRGFAKLARATLASAAAFVKWGGVGVGALGTAVVLLNKASVEAEALAKSVGVGVDVLEGLGAAIEPAGFQLDNIVDLVEEMNNKLGESAGLAQITPVQESLAILNLRFKDLKKLAPEDQFKAIINATLKLKDAQKAQAAADILLGGEANKIVGALRAQGKTVEEIVQAYQALNFQTARSRRGAGAFTTEFNKVAIIVATLAKQAAGLVGEALTPLLNRLTEWAKLNKDLIQTKLADFIDKVVKGVTELSERFSEFSKDNNFGKNLETITSAAQSAIDVFSILGSVIKGVGRAFQVTGTFIGETAAKLSLAKFEGFTPALSGSQSAFGGVAPALVSSPQERTARILEEKKVTNTTEVTLKDETGRAKVTKSSGGGGFSMGSTAVFE